MDGPGHLDTATLALKYRSIGSAISVSSSTFVSSSGSLAAVYLETVDLAPATPKQGYHGWRSQFTGVSYPWPTGTYVLLSVLDAAGLELITLVHDENYILRVHRGGYSGALIATAPAHAQHENAYLEFGWYLDETSGTLEIRKYDEGTGASSTVVAVTGVNTSAGNWSRIKHYIGSGFAHQRSHFYINDADGVYPAYFLGPQRVYTCFVDAAGAHSDWTPNTGTNPGAVDDAAPDADSTYLRTQVNGAKERQTIDPTPIPVDVGQINALQCNAIARKESSSFTNRIIPTITGASDIQDPSQALATSYSDYRLNVGLNPDTGTFYTRAEVAALEIGANHQS